VPTGQRGGNVARIYVSSSYRDLHRYRRRAAEKVRELGHVAVGMEADGAQEARPLDVCLRQVRSCDGYFGIVALRYGSSPPAYPDKSYTELEYEEAAAAAKKLMWLVAHPEVTDLAPPYKDEDPRLKASLESFRSRVSTHSIAKFSSLPEFAEAAHKAINTNFGLGSFVPDMLPHLCDRQDQECALEDALLARLPQRPVLLVVHGDRREAQSQFIKRLRIDSLPRLLVLPKSDTVSHYRLTWPETPRDAADMERWLIRELKRVNGQQRPCSVADLFQKMTETRMPTLVSVLVDGDRWSPSEMKPLSGFIRFWQEAPDFASVQPLVVCLAISYPPARKEARWWQVWQGRQRDPSALFATLVTPPSPAIALSLAPRLGDGSVTRQQVNNWLERDVRPLLAALHLDEVVFQQRVDALFTEHETTSNTAYLPMGPLADGLFRAMHASRRVPTNGELFE
jgi:hypothetical protein